RRRARRARASGEVRGGTSGYSMLVILALVVAALVSQQPETLSLLGEPLYPLPLSKSDRAQADETLRAAHAAYENEPNAVANVLALARAHLAFGRVGDAIEILTHGLEANADDPQLLRDRGRGYILIRKFDIAQRDLRKSAEKAPEATCDLALAQYLAGAFPHAQASYAHCQDPGVFGYLSARRSQCRTSPGRQAADRAGRNQDAGLNGAEEGESASAAGDRLPRRRGTADRGKEGRGNLAPQGHRAEAPQGRVDGSGIHRRGSRLRAGLQAAPQEEKVRRSEVGGRRSGYFGAPFTPSQPGLARPRPG